MSRANAFEPVTLVRSPTLTKSESSPMFTASRPESRSRFSIVGTLRGAMSRTCAAIAAMCSGVVPQQPPTMLRNPACANSSSRQDVCSGVSS